MNQVLENLLESYYLQEGNDIIKYNKLSEDDKTMFSKEIVARIVKSIEDKSYSLDNTIIDRSKGDITKLDNYHYINDSLELLNNMNSMYTDKIPYLDTLNDARTNLVKNADNFKKGYTANKEIIKILYSQLVLSLIQSISFVIAVNMDYIKDPVGNYEVNLRYNVEKLNKYPTVNIECLKKFNEMTKTGELDHFFVTVLSNKTIKNEDVVASPFEVLDMGLATLGDVGRTLIAIFKFMPGIPEILRLLVSMSLNTRLNIRDYLLLQAMFIELNVEKNKAISNPNKNVIRKQEAIVRKLIKLADKVDIDQKTSDKNTRNEIKKENKDISKSIKNTSSNVSTANVPEEIIL